MTRFQDPCRSRFIDTGDHAHLRHGRDQHDGFHIGRFLQPPAMLFTRDGHNLFLGDLYRGCSAFLLCAGPSLRSHDLNLLAQPGILTMAVNNAAVVYRPHLWVSVDDPSHFSDVIWRDPAITKFVPLCHMEKHFCERSSDGTLVESKDKVGDMPAVAGYRRNERFAAEQWLYEDTFNWGMHSDHRDDYGQKGGRSVFYVALRLLFFLGVRRVFLLGCDFRMEHGKQNYVFDQDRSPSSVRGNNRSYEILNVRLAHLVPEFEREGFDVVNCTPNSGLTVFPYRSFDDAITICTNSMPKNVDTRGMYDRTANMKRHKQQPSDSAAHILGGELQILRDITLITVIDERFVHFFKETWPTWMRFKPQLREAQMILVYDADMILDDHTLALVDQHPDVRIEPWSMAGDIEQREKMLTSWVKIPAECVNTKWYLKIDADAYATSAGPVLDPSWFEPDESSDLPVLIASPWGYTKPSTAIHELDEWADQEASLNLYPRLNLPFDRNTSLVSHSRINSWYSFGCTEWTRQMARLVPSRLPVPSQDTFLWYCAARQRKRIVTPRMRNYGFTNRKRLSSVQKACRSLLK